MNIRARLLKAVTTVVAGLTVLIPAHALAVVLWSAAPPSANLSDGVQADASTGSPLSQSLSPLAGSVIINKITWWGFYQDSNGAPLADGTPSYADDFVVTFNSSAPVSAAGMTKSIDPIGGGSLLSRYELSGLALMFASAPISIDIINNFNDGGGNNLADATWFWQGTGRNSLAYVIEGERGHQVPEPVSLLLLALGLVSLSLMQWNKRATTIPLR